MRPSNVRGTRPVGATASADNLVLMLHCSASSSVQWRGLSGRLAGCYRAVSPDFFDCGAREPWPGHKALDLIDQVRLATAALPARSGQAHVVGHSFGGAVALRAALELGEKLASLTLIEPSAFHLLRSDQAEDANLFEEIDGIARAVSCAVENGHYWAGMSIFTDYWGGPHTWAGLPQEAKIRLAQHARIVLTDFAALFAESTPIGSYRRIVAPTLILRGTESPTPSRRICDMLAARLPDTRVVEVAGAGHLLPFTHAKQVESAIADHVVRCDLARGKAPAAPAA